MLDGQVKLSAAMLHQEKAITARHRIPDGTTETTQVKALPDAVDLAGAAVTAGAVHAQRQTAEYSAGNKDDGNRGSDCFLPVKGSRPALQRAVLDALQDQGPREPDHTGPDRGHGRIIRRSIWVADPAGIGFPHLSRAARIRRDRYGTDGALISKEIIHAVTSPDAGQADAASLAKIARGQRGIESVHWPRDTARAEDASTGYAGNGPQVTATLRNLAVSLLLSRRRQRDHTHSPGHRTRPHPHARLPAAMRHRSQTTLPIPWHRAGRVLGGRQRGGLWAIRGRWAQG